MRFFRRRKERQLQEQREKERRRQQREERSYVIPRILESQRLNPDEQAFYIDMYKDGIIKESEIRWIWEY